MAFGTWSWWGQTHAPDAFTPRKMFLVLIFTRGWVDPRAMVRLEGNMSLKNPVTPPGIDPGTVRQVTQLLNHYAIPYNILYYYNILTIVLQLPTAGVGNLLVVLCRSNVTKSLIVPTHPSPPYFYIQQPLKHVNLILSKLSFWRDVKTGIALKELYASI